jgi:hypothetical protein
MELKMKTIYFLGLFRAKQIGWEQGKKLPKGCEHPLADPHDQRLSIFDPSP